MNWLKAESATIKAFLGSDGNLPAWVYSENTESFQAACAYVEDQNIVWKLYKQPDLTISGVTHFIPLPVPTRDSVFHPVQKSDWSQRYFQKREKGKAR